MRRLLMQVLSCVMCLEYKGEKQMQMDFTTVINAISNVGFPITLAVVFGYLIWRLGKKINDTAEKNMAELQK